MTTYHVPFKDGSEGYCDGKDALNAMRIAERKTGQRADVADRENPALQCLPRKPMGSMIWEANPLEPGHCWGGHECHGRHRCPKRNSCIE